MLISPLRTVFNSLTIRQTGNDLYSVPDLLLCWPRFCFQVSCAILPGGIYSYDYQSILRALDFIFQTEIEKLRTCTEQDVCDCRNVFGPDTFPWSNKFSYALQQISIARSPKVHVLMLSHKS